MAKYVIEKYGYSTAIVELTEREAAAIENFMMWADISDEYCIEKVDDYKAEVWGEEPKR